MSKVLTIKSWLLFLMLGVPLLTLNQDIYWQSVLSFLIFILYLIWIGAIYKFSDTPKDKRITKWYKYSFITVITLIGFATVYPKSFPMNDFVIVLMTLASILGILFMLVNSAIAFTNWSIKTDNYIFNSFGAFLFLIFYPIGIWILQPRLNKMSSQN